MITPDRLIVSSTNDHFLDFLPTVSHVWRKMFPNIKISIAIVDDGVPSGLKFLLSKYADVYSFPHFYAIPKPNMAKIARFLTASECGGDICIIEDIDTIPLEKPHILKFLEQYDKDKILMVGKEVYLNNWRYDKNEEGKCPISYMTGSGEVFKKLFNPQGLQLVQLLEQLCSLPKYIGEKEGITNPPEFFSDESLIRALIYHRGVDYLVKKIDRNIDTDTQCIDREWFMDKDVDYDKLNRGEYLYWNCCRPLFQKPFKVSYPKVIKLMSHIYQKSVTIEDILL